jgi:hypothetical protein
MKAKRKLFVDSSTTTLVYEPDFEESNSPKLDTTSKFNERLARKRQTPSMMSYNQTPILLTDQSFEFEHKSIAEFASPSYESLSSK